MTDRLERTVSDLRRKWVPDHRLGVFEVSVVEGGEGEGRKLVGATTSREALAAVQRLAAEAGLGEGAAVAGVDLFRGQELDAALFEQTDRCQDIGRAEPDAQRRAHGGADPADAIFVMPRTVLAVHAP